MPAQCTDLCGNYIRDSVLGERCLYNLSCEENKGKGLTIADSEHTSLGRTCLHHGFYEQQDLAQLVATYKPTATITPDTASRARLMEGIAGIE